MEKAKSQLEGSGVAELTCDNINSQSRLFITTASKSKGFEFDNVIIPDFDDYPQAGLLYVAMTRALHGLYIITGDKKIVE